MGYYSNVLIRAKTGPPEVFREIYNELARTQPNWFLHLAILKPNEVRAQADKYIFNEQEFYFSSASMKHSQYESDPLIIDLYAAYEHFERLAHTSYAELDTCQIIIGDGENDISETSSNNGSHLGRVDISIYLSDENRQQTDYLYNKTQPITEK